MSAGKPSLVYFGTPDLAVPPLQALVESGGFNVLAVVTQNDKPAGRGNKLTPPPVKQFAESRSLPVFQPTSLKSISRAGMTEPLTGSKSNLPLVQFLNEHAPIDLFFVVAYGKIIPDALLDFPRHGILNLHMSLLPQLRGAAPIQRAVLNGDTLSGVSLMKIDQGIDTGPVYAVASVPILEDDTSGSLTEKLVARGTALMLDSLPKILDGTLSASPQSSEGASYAEKLEKHDFRLDWSLTAAQLLRRIRAGAPRPGAFTALDNQPVKIFAAHAQPNQNYPASEPGTIVEANSAELVIQCGHGEYLHIEELQLAGKKRLPAAEVVKGRGISKNSRLV